MYEIGYGVSRSADRKKPAVLAGGFGSHVLSRNTVSCCQNQYRWDGRGGKDGAEKRRIAKELCLQFLFFARYYGLWHGLLGRWKHKCP